MRCLVASCFGLALLGAVCGCRSCDRVESALRARETESRELRDELDHCCILNQTLEQELRALRGELGLPSPDGQPPAAYPVRSLALGRQTGGRGDGKPGDESLQVQVEPRDTEGQSIKAPGTLFVQVQEITKEGVKRPLSSWEIPPDKLRRSWRSGLLTTGYVLNLPWKVWPTTEKQRVTAQLQLVDGRVFEADKDITVRLMPVNRRPVLVPEEKAPPAFPPAPHPAPESGPSLLPPPQLFNPVNRKKPTPQETKADSTLWKAVDLPQPPPAAEILTPVPIKREN